MLLAYSAVAKLISGPALSRTSLVGREHRSQGQPRLPGLLEGNDGDGMSLCPELALKQALGSQKVAACCTRSHLRDAAERLGVPDLGALAHVTRLWADLIS